MELARSVQVPSQMGWRLQGAFRFHPKWDEHFKVLSSSIWFQMEVSNSFEAPSGFRWRSRTALKLHLVSDEGFEQL
jgi:hypothetical protein